MGIFVMVAEHPFSFVVKVSLIARNVATHTLTKKCNTTA